MNSPATDRLFIHEIEARAARLAEDEFVEFSYAGAAAVGHFCCVACGRGVTCVGLLPSCPGCGGRLWEDASTSPFAVSSPSPVAHDAYAQWLEEDLESTARTIAGVSLAVLSGLAFWALLAVAVVYAVAH